MNCKTLFSLGLSFDNARREISQNLQVIRRCVKTSAASLQIFGSRQHLPREINGSFVSELDRAHRHLWSLGPKWTAIGWTQREPFGDLQI